MIESVFGQYKHLNSDSSLQEVGKMVLLLPLLVIELSADCVHQALEKVDTVKVDEWAQKTFGPSALARRRAAFAAT